MLSSLLYQYKKNRDYKDIELLYSALKKNELLSKEQLRELTFSKLRLHLRYCYDNVPFYKNLWDKHGIDIQIKSLDDFNQFPLVNKDMLKKGLADNSAISCKLINTNLYYTETTGSTGTPFRYPLDNDAISKRHSVVLRSYDWYNYKLGSDKCIKFWRGSSVYTWKDAIREYAYKNYYFSIYDPADPKKSSLTEQKAAAFISRMKKIRPQVIDGFVSAITYMAKYIIDHDIHLDIPLQSIATGAEYLSPKSRALIESAFHVPVYNRYGGTESGLIAHETFEETQHKHYLHISSDSIYAELYNQNKIILDGEGEVVFTDFSNLAMPFVKYVNGDIGTFSVDAVSKSALPFPFFTDIKGRINDYFLLPDGSLLSSHIWHNYFRQAPFIKEFQIIQEERNLVKVIYITEDDSRIDQAGFDQLIARVASALPRCEVIWEKVDHIPAGTGGKFRHSLSKLKIELNEIRS